MSSLKYSEVVRLSRTGGERFSAVRASQHSFEGLMSPVLGFDHFRLTADVFGPHRHAGMSAVSYVFEDSVPYHNEDSMGTDLTITPGSLLWTWAGSGVVHHEVATVEGGEVHGLQLFLDIAPARRSLPAKSVFIPKEKMPEIAEDGLSVRVVMGSTSTTVNPVATPEPVTLLDITLASGKSYVHPLPAGFNGTVYVLSGGIEVGGEALQANEAIAFGAATTSEPVTVTASADSRLLLISGPPVGG